MIILNTFLSNSDSLLSIDTSQIYIVYIEVVIWDRDVKVVFTNKI